MKILLFKYAYIYIERKYMKNSVIAIESFVITTIVYVLLVPVFFEMDNAFGEEKTLLMMIMIRRHKVNN